MDKKVERIIWSKRSNQVTAGAKLLSASGDLKSGDPVVVQLLLRNELDREQTVVLQQIRSHPVLGSENRISLNVLSGSASPVQHVLKPGEVLEDRRYRVMVSTDGLPSGEYFVSVGTAFWMAVEGAPSRATGISHRVPIPFSINAPDTSQWAAPPRNDNPRESVHWGRPVAGLVLGMRLPQGRRRWPNDQVTIEGQLFAFNASEDPIDFQYELPATPSQWNLNVESQDNGAFVSLDWTWFSGFRPVQSRFVSIKPGQVKALTGVLGQVVAQPMAYQNHLFLKPTDDIEPKMIAGPKVQILKEKTEFGPGDPKRLIGRTGRFTFESSLTVHRENIADLTMVLTSAPVPIEVVVPSDGDVTDTDAPNRGSTDRDVTDR